MKICMITSYPPDKCGVSDYSERLVRELRRSGENVLIISRQGPGYRNERDIRRLIDTKKVKRSFTQLAEEFRGIARAYRDAEESILAIKNFGADVAHVQYEPGLYNLFFVPILLSKLKKAGIKSVVTLHGIDYFPLTVFHRTFLYGSQDRLIVHTKHHFNTLKSDLSGKVLEKIRIIPMGLVKEKPSKEGKYALFFGFLNQHKGVEELLQAFSRMKTKNRLVVIGSINPAYRPDVKYKNKIADIIRSLDIGDRVKFIYGFVPSKNLENYIKNSMFVVFPYRASYSGGQSQAVTDSIAFGKPLIVTKPAQGNLVNNENAIVINPGSVEELTDALRKLFGSKKIRKKLSSNNRKLAKKLRWDNISRMTKNVYRTI
ncbi:MAG: glycosyltransferase [Candidatus Aenigmarchaeota archaeon]|nr:glycosyltransferase [Candidatus Aenigmarchaeota archaeon]